MTRRIAFRNARLIDPASGLDAKGGLLVEIDVGLKPDGEFIYMAHAEGRHPPAKLRALA